jgi:hypothetical protein
MSHVERIEQWRPASATAEIQRDSHNVLLPILKSSIVTTLADLLSIRFPTSCDSSLLIPWHRIRIPVSKSSISARRRKQLERSALPNATRCRESSPRACQGHESYVQHQLCAVASQRQASATTAS